MTELSALNLSETDRFHLKPGEKIEDEIEANPFMGFVECDIGIRKNKIVMLNLNDCFVSQTYLRKGPNSYESMSVSMWILLAKGANGIIDVGSYTGIYALSAAEVNKSAIIVAFEPATKTYYRLCNNIRINGFEGAIEPVLAGASSITGYCDLHHPVGVYKLSSGETFEQTSAVYELERSRIWVLDNFLAGGKLKILKRSIQKVDLCKIDVEGHEIHVLQGMKKTIENDQPILLVEILTKENFEVVVSMIKGFKWFSVDEHNLTMSDTEAVGRNFYFIPERKIDVFRDAWRVCESALRKQDV